MKIEAKEVTLKDGRNVTLRSPEPKDALKIIDTVILQAGETHFLANYPEELKERLTEEREINFINRMNEAEGCFTIYAFDKDMPIGEVEVNSAMSKLKMKHRASLEIAINQSYCNSGLGTMLMEEALRLSKQIGFERVELGVFDDNTRAYHLYQKMGFKVTGVIPESFKLKDGTYHDLILMSYKL